MNFLRRMMTGRYGNDQLNSAILVAGVIACLIEWLTGWRLLSYVMLALLAICYFRMFSRNINARYQENQKFLHVWNPMKSKITGAKARFQDRKVHAYFKCPKCSNRLRVPKGRGKINITCPHCKTQFIKKT